MGKIFITDEVNDQYIAQVTKAKKLKVEVGSSRYKMLPSACSTASGGYTISNGPCYLDRIIIGRIPLSAACIYLFDTSAHGNSSADGAGASALSTAGASAAGDLLSFGPSGTNIIAALYIDATGALSGGGSGSGTFPRVFDFNVYCASGLVAQIGDPGVRQEGAVGNLKSVTVYYTTLS